MSERMIPRHTRLSIFMHWFNAFCWIALLLTGLGLIKNEQLNPVGAWWPNLMRSPPCSAAAKTSWPCTSTWAWSGPAPFFSTRCSNPGTPGSS